MTSTQTVTDHVVFSMMKIYEDPNEKRIAEYTSPCSDLPTKVIIPISTAKEAKAALFVLSVITDERDGISRLPLIDHIAQMAYNYRYEGEWSEVQEILELNTLMPYFVGVKLFEQMNENDYYGNFVPLVLRKTKEAKRVPMYPKQKRKVKFPQRKRGYDDKGTLRPSHKWLPKDVHLGKNPEPEDYRSRSHTPRNQYFWILRKKGDPPYE